MSVISFPFNFEPRSKYLLQGTVSSYVPPGNTGGQRSTASYTVPNNTRSLITFSAGVLMRIFPATYPDTVAANLPYTFVDFGVSGDIFVIFVDWYWQNASSSSAPYAYRITLVKNGTNVHDIFVTGNAGSSIPVGTVSSLIQANEFNV